MPSSSFLNDVFYRRFLECISMGRLYKMKTILDNVRFNIDYILPDGSFALKVACEIPDKIYKTRAKVIKLLLDHGADPCTRTCYGLTVFAWACKHNKLDIVHILIDKSITDIDLNAKDDQGDTPLMHATRTGDVQLVRTVLAALNRFHLSVDICNSMDVTPYLEARNLGYDEIALVLREEGKASLSIQICPFLQDWQRINSAVYRTLSIEQDPSTCSTPGTSDGSNSVSSLQYYKQQLTTCNSTSVSTSESSRPMDNGGHLNKHAILSNEISNIDTSNCTNVQNVDVINLNSKNVNSRSDDGNTSKTSQGNREFTEIQIVCENVDQIDHNACENSKKQEPQVSLRKGRILEPAMNDTSMAKGERDSPSKLEVVQERVHDECSQDIEKELKQTNKTSNLRSTSSCLEQTSANSKHADVNVGRRSVLGRSLSRRRLTNRSASSLSQVTFSTPEREVVSSQQTDGNWLVNNPTSKKNYGSVIRYEDIYELCPDIRVSRRKSAYHDLRWMLALQAEQKETNFRIGTPLISQRQFQKRDSSLSESSQHSSSGVASGSERGSGFFDTTHKTKRKISVVQRRTSAFPSNMGQNT